jgi:hypothetical protein
VQVDDAFPGLDLGVDRLSLVIAVDPAGAEAEHANQVVVCRRYVLIDEDGDHISHIAVGQ